MANCAPLHHLLMECIGRNCKWIQRWEIGEDLRKCHCKADDWTNVIHYPANWHFPGSPCVPPTRPVSLKFHPTGIYCTPSCSCRAPCGTVRNKTDSVSDFLSSQDTKGVWLEQKGSSKWLTRASVWLPDTWQRMADSFFLLLPLSVSLQFQRPLPTIPRPFDGTVPNGSTERNILK